LTVDYEVKETLGCVVRDADRAKDIVGRMRDHIKKSPPLVGGTHKIYVVAGLIDEHAAAVNKVPVAYRRALLQNNPRALHVVNRHHG
jgi:hypothetical protein